MSVGAAQYLASVKVDRLSLGLFLAQAMEVCKLYVTHTIPLTQLEVDEGAPLINSTRNLKISTAFRALLQRVIIPSESQHLNRIISGFASAYYQANSAKSCYPCDGMECI